MRVTNTIIFNNALTNIRMHNERLLRAQQEVGSGKKLLQPSDDPVATRRILSLRRILRSVEQFQRNGTTIATLLQETDTALGGVEDILLRAKTLALSAVNDTVNPENRAAMALEVGHLLEQALQLGNTMVEGRYIFAGRATDQAPFSAQAIAESRGQGLTTSGTLTPLGEDELIINGITIRAPQGTDDTVSTSDNAASALALAAVINEASAMTGVRAEASTTLSLTITRFGDLGGDNLRINGVAITGTITDAASLVDAINAARIDGVFASSSGPDNLTLTAPDGRNIQLQTDGLASGGLSFAEFDLGGGVASDQTATGSVTLRADTAFTIGGLQPEKAGFRAGVVPLSVQFNGDNGLLSMEMNSGQRLPVNVTASRFLVTDLRPLLDRDTPLAALQKGEGISTGSIQITDRAGNTAVVDLSGAVTVGDVLDAISGAGLNVSATINETGDGLLLIDNTAAPVQNLIVTEVGGGSTAHDLGIAGERAGNLVGTPLSPVLTPATPLSSLYEGRGVTPTAIRIVNGPHEVEVDLSEAQTVGDVLEAINTAGADVTAQINTAGTAIDVRSNDANTVAVVTEVDGGSTASDLGIQGAQDAFKTLSLLQEALQKNDRYALEALLSTIDLNVDQVLGIRADVGTRMNRVAMVSQGLDDLHFSTTSYLSQTEDADMSEAVAYLSQLTTMFQASLATTARIMQPTLLDFLR
ncbi:MAG: flagellar hook-associated protein 3 [Nitrospinota bacterium]|nr:MAG: flagellar hook-associated protein 3 [Nitrospinota bacterium]